MSLYQPSYMEPRNSTIDCTIEEEMKFSCRLNGNSLLFGYDIEIYDASSNDLVFKLTSPESKEILENQLLNKEDELDNLENSLSDRLTLLEDYANDDTDKNFEIYLDALKVECENLFNEMNECILGLRPISSFFEIGDEVISKIDASQVERIRIQNIIESTYFTVDSVYEKRLSNNTIQIDVNKRKYGTYKTSNNPTEAAIDTLRVLLDFVVSNISSDDGSTKRIILEYWGEIPMTIQNQIDDINTLKAEVEIDIENLNTAINNLNQGMFLLTNPIYPVDYLGNHTILSHYIPVGVLENGKNYKWKIILYWSSTENKDNLDKSILSQENYFECRTTPIVEISNIGEVIGKKYYEFVGKYIQEQFVPVSYFRWVLKRLPTEELLVDTGYIASSDIRFYYDGFLNYTEYQIQLFVRNQNGIEVESKIYNFKISYIGVVIDNILSASPSLDEHGIAVEWSGVHGITAKSYGDVKFIANMPVQGHTSIQLAEGASILFDEDNNVPLKIPTFKTSYIMSVRIDNKDMDILFEATGTSGGLDYYKRLSLDGNDLVYDMNGLVQIRETIDPSPLYWYIIFLLPDKMLISKKWASGLFPATDLYPKIGLYPQQLKYNNTEGEVFI